MGVKEAIIQWYSEQAADEYDENVTQRMYYPCVKTT